MSIFDRCYHLNELFETKVVELEDLKFNNPMVIGGFVGNTPTGFIAASYIIERLQLHQFAHVKSPHIPPISVFIGNKLRTPFRIYTNKDGTLIVTICEVPITDEGLYEISSALLSWLADKNAGEYYILEGAPVTQIVNDHMVFCVANEEKLAELTKMGMEAANSALIMGMGGAILNECLARKITGVTFLTQSTVNIPDPGAVLALIENVNDALGLKIDTGILEQSVKDFHRQLQELMEQYKKMYIKQEKPPSETMYG